MVLLRVRFIVTPSVAARAVVSYTAVSSLPLTEINGGLLFCDTALSGVFRQTPFVLLPELENLVRHAALRSSDFPHSLLNAIARWQDLIFNDRKTHRSKSITLRHHSPNPLHPLRPHRSL